jgi:hypothetical protein
VSAPGHAAVAHREPSAEHGYGPPLLGIFWCVLAEPAGGATARLLARECTLEDAEEYGDCLTSPAGHLDTWEAWARGGLARHPPDVAAVIRTTEYEEWPRGRIVLDRSIGRFVLYADRQLLPRAAAVRARFRLPEDRTVLRTDGHYRSARRIPSSTWTAT